MVELRLSSLHNLEVIVQSWEAGREGLHWGPTEKLSSLLTAQVYPAASILLLWMSHNTFLF